MKTLLILLLLMLPTGEIAAQTASRIEVLKFSWDVYNPDREFIDEPPPINSTSTRLPELNNRQDDRMMERTIEERSRNLTRAERAAARNSAQPPEKLFVYALKIKKLDARTIRSFVWEYQTDAENAPQKSTPRRFLCVEKIKPSASKTLKTISHLPPFNVVDASRPQGKKSDDSSVNITISRVEYEDGTVWQNPDREDPGAALDSPLLAEKLKSSDCAAF